MTIKQSLEGVVIGAIPGLIIGTVAGISSGFSDAETLDSFKTGLVPSEILTLIFLYKAPVKEKVVTKIENVVYYVGGFVATGVAYTGMFYNAI